MTLEPILSRINGEISIEKEKIIQEARQKAQRIIADAKSLAAALYEQVFEKEKDASGRIKQKMIVEARLKARNKLLRTKQELIDIVFSELKSSIKKEKLKKKQVTPDSVRDVPEDIDFFLGKIRLEYETEIAKTLFE